MSKKIILINGSARKKNTYNVLLQIEKILKDKGFETEIINLFDYRIADCVGCETCVGNNACILKDDMPAVMEKILDSDALVFGSPVYMDSVTSRFKTFADRSNVWVHKPQLAGKPVMFAATTASTGIKEIKRFFGSYSTGLGMRKGECVYRVGRKITDPIEKKELSRFLTLLEKDTKYYAPEIDEIIMFTVQKVMALKSSKDDRKFWEEKNWFDKSYYYPCKMNIRKKLFSKFIFKAISKAMN